MTDIKETLSLIDSINAGSTNGATWKLVDDTGRAEYVRALDTTSGDFQLWMQAPGQDRQWPMNTVTGAQVVSPDDGTWMSQFAAFEAKAAYEKANPGLEFAVICLMKPKVIQ